MGWWSKLFKAEKPIEIKDTRTGRLIVEATGNSVVWTKEDYVAYAEEAFKENSVAYRCIDEIARSVSQVPWKLWKKKEDQREAIYNDPIVSLLTRANPRESFPSMMYRLVSFLLISGNTYIERTPKGGKIPKELWVLRPDRIKIRPGNTATMVGKYEYTINGKTVDYLLNKDGTSDLLHIRLFNPLDDYYGMSPIKPSSRQIDTSNKAAEWNMRLLDNECRPSIIFNFPQDVTTEQIDQFVLFLEKSKTGPKNAGKYLITQGLEKATPFGFDMAELDFIEGNRETARRIAGTFGVPPMLIGIIGDATFANYKEARLAFWENTITFYLEMLKHELNSFLFGKQKIGEEKFLEYDLNNAPAMSPRREMNWDRARNSSFMRLDEKREMVGLPRIGGEIGASILTPTNHIPIEQILEGEGNKPGSSPGYGDPDATPLPNDDTGNKKSEE